MKPSTLLTVFAFIEALTAAPIAAHGVEITDNVSNKRPSQIA
jgi:hypothetical protein